jgi:inorganic pyrophosphatase
MLLNNVSGLFARYHGVRKNGIRALSSFARFTAGESGADSYRLFLTNDKKKISPWHDIPLHAGGLLFHYINEIPKNTRAKMEIATRVENNPIAQDMNNGKLRFYHGPIYWNYGCFPQTWEDPGVKHPDLVRHQ